MPTADEFRVELRSQLKAADARGERWIEVNSGELHRTLGGYPARSHAMRNCCSVMRQEQQAGDIVVSAPEKGDGASVTIRYRLPR